MHALLFFSIFTNISRKIKSDKVVAAASSRWSDSLYLTRSQQYGASLIFRFRYWPEDIAENTKYPLISMTISQYSRTQHNSYWLDFYTGLLSRSSIAFIDCWRPWSCWLPLPLLQRKLMHVFIDVHGIAILRLFSPLIDLHRYFILFDICCILASARFQKYHVIYIYISLRMPDIRFTFSNTISTMQGICASLRRWHRAWWYFHWYYYCRWSRFSSSPDTVEQLCFVSIYFLISFTFIYHEKLARKFRSSIITMIEFRCFHLKAGVSIESDILAQPFSLYADKAIPFWLDFNNTPYTFRFLRCAAYVFPFGYRHISAHVCHYHFRKKLLDGDTLIDHSIFWWSPQGVDAHKATYASANYIFSHTQWAVIDFDWMLIDCLLRLHMGSTLPQTKSITWYHKRCIKWLRW